MDNDLDNDLGDLNGSFNFFNAQPRGTLQQDEIMSMLSGTKYQPPEFLADSYFTQSPRRSSRAKNSPARNSP